MSVIYRTTDVVNVKVDKLNIGISPLNYKVKADMQALLVQGRAFDAAVMALKHGLKSVKGLKLSDGSDYNLSFENDQLSDQHIDDLMNIPEQGKLTIIALDLLNGIPQNGFIDPQTGDILEGVKIVKKVSSRKK